MTADVLRRAFEPFFTTTDIGKGMGFVSRRPKNFANVAAWTEDCYVEDYRHTPTDGNPNTSGPCTPRVVRGGSCDDDLQVDRAARRYYYAQGDRVDNLGFRLARVVPP